MREAAACVFFTALTIALTTVPRAVAGQQEIGESRFFLALSLGPVVPLGAVADITDTGLGLDLALGYHVHRVLRLDLGFEGTFGSSGTTSSITISGVTSPVKMGYGFLRVGPSLVFPAGDRSFFSVGGGTAWSQYRTSPVLQKGTRGGRGLYGSVSLHRMLWEDGSMPVGLGVFVTLYDVDTDGNSLGGLFEGASEERWLSVTVSLWMAWRKTFN